jgi:hypothetical protein
VFIRVAQRILAAAPATFDTDFSFLSGVLGDVGDPQAVRRVGGELPVDQIRARAGN